MPAFELSWSLFDLPAYGTMMQSIARANAEDALRGDSYANTDIAVRLVFFGSDGGGDPYGFDPEDVTDPAIGACSSDARRDVPSGWPVAGEVLEASAGHPWVAA